MAFKGAKGSVTIIDKATRPLKSIANAFLKLGNSSKKTNKDLSNTQKAINGISKAQNRLNRVNANIKRNTRDIGSQAVGVAALALSFKAALNPAIEFESAFAGVKKVASGTPKEIEALRKSLLKLSGTMPNTASELSEIAESGAKMGFATKELSKFTTIVAKASTAFDMTASDAGAAFGKISSVLGFGMGQLAEYGDRVNFLADNIAADAGGIIDITKRVAGAFGSLGLGTGDVAGLAAFADQMSVSSEIGATALNQIINKLRATESGAKLFEKHGGKALVIMAEKFKKLSGVARSSAIQKMFGVGEGSRMFEKMINQTDKLKKALDLGNQTDALGSMTREFEAMSNTTANKMKVLGNIFTRISIAIGDHLLPNIKSIIDNLAPMIDTIGIFASENKELIITIAKIGAVLLAGKIAMIAYTASIWLVSPAITALSAVLTLIKAPLVTMNLLMNANPIGLLIAGFAALTVAGLYLYETFQPVRDFLDGFNDVLQTIFNSVMDVIEAFSNLKIPDLKMPSIPSFGDIGSSISETAGGAFDSVSSFFGGSPEQATRAINANSTTNVPVAVSVNIADGRVQGVETSGGTKTDVFLNDGRQF